MTSNSATSSKSNQTNKPKLDDAEIIILMAAAKREDGIALPVPDSISAPAEQVARKIRRLIKLSLLHEIPHKLGDGLWRKSDDDRHLTLKITPFAFDVLGLDLPETMKAARNQQATAVDSARSGRDAMTAERPRAVKKTARPLASSDEEKAVARNRPPRGSRKEENASRLKKASKTQMLLALLERSKGASLGELMKASGWQAHSVRGFLSAVVKKKLCLKVSSETNDKGARRYRVKLRAKA
jgi:hypothetical protein